MATSDDRPAFGRGLSTKILALAVAFLLLGEVLIFVPSISRFRLSYLESMLAAGHLAILVKQQAPGGRPDLATQVELLHHVGARAVRLWSETGNPGRGLGEVDMVDRVYDLRATSPFVLMLDAFDTLAGGEPRIIRVVGRSRVDPSVVVDVVLDEASLRQQMWAYAWRILVLSLVLSAIVASLLLLALRRMIISPLAAISRQLMAFRERPDDLSAEPVLSGRGDEIGIVERELVEMQRRVRQALFQKTRLAALGAAVGQVSHDLRNILSSAVLISDRLETSADPAVRTMASRLMMTLERAIRLCRDTLQFAKEQPPAPRFEHFELRELVREIAAATAVEADAVIFDNQVAGGIEVVADRDQMFRVLFNLARNAHEALAGRPGRITVRARRSDGWIGIEVADDGPGVPPEVAGELFESFGGSTKAEGSGLGLAICRELMRAHGGDIELARTGAEGTTFKLALPDRSIAAAA